jgi:hypothetical protein
MKPCLVVRAGILAQHPHGRAKPSDAPVADHQPGLRRLLQRQPASSVWQGRRVSQTVSQSVRAASMPLSVADVVPVFAEQRVVTQTGSSLTVAIGRSRVG